MHFHWFLVTTVKGMLFKYFIIFQCSCISHVLHALCTCCSWARLRPAAAPPCVCPRERSATDIYHCNACRWRAAHHHSKPWDTAGHYGDRGQGSRARRTSRRRWKTETRAQPVNENNLRWEWKRLNHYRKCNETFTISWFLSEHDTISNSQFMHTHLIWEGFLEKLIACLSLTIGIVRVFERVRFGPPLHWEMSHFSRTLIETNTTLAEQPLIQLTTEHVIWMCFSEGGTSSLTGNSFLSLSPPVVHCPPSGRRSVQVNPPWPSAQTHPSGFLQW